MLMLNDRPPQKEGGRCCDDYFVLSQFKQPVGLL